MKNDLERRWRPTKYCPDCQRELPVAAFHRDSRRNDGLGFYCRDCANSRVVESRRRRNGPPRTRHGQGPTGIADGFKWCPECSSIKAITEFPRNRSARSGLGAYCKPCHNKITKANKEKHGGARNYHLRRRYGITAEHADRMLTEQDGLCAICREAPAGHVDHDHATGRVRGLLCFNCNGALGQFRDRVDLMLRAAEYLQRDADPTGTPVPAHVFGAFVGDFSDPQPVDEPRSA